jgi:hypothetical protein
MTDEAGWVALGVVPTLDKNGMAGFGRSLDSSLGRAAKGSGSKFGHLLGKAAVAGAAGVIGAGFAAFKLGQDAVNQASDLNESLNAVNLSYNKQSRAVKKLGRDAAQSLGLSNSEFNGLAVQFSSFSKTVAGGGGKKVVKVLDDLTTRASDFASVMNLEVAESAALFQSGLAGETEPLRRYGLDLSAAAVEAHALSLGMEVASEGLTESQKIQARYSLLMKQTSQTQGDFANTSGELANSQRILSAEWKNAQAELGTALLPIMKDAVGFVLDKGIPAFEDFSEWFTAKGIPAIGDFADEVKPLAKELLPAAASAFGEIRDFGKEALPYVEGVVKAFNDMPDWAKKALIGGVAAGVVGAKLLPDKGSGGIVGGLLGGERGSSPANPVFVTSIGPSGPGNKSFLGGLAAAALAVAKKVPKAAPFNLVRDEGIAADGSNVGTQADHDAAFALLQRQQLDIFRHVKSIFGVQGQGRDKALEQTFGGKFDKKRELGARQLADATLFKDTFAVSPKGIDKAQKDFLRLIDYRNDLHRNRIEPSVQILGLPQAKRQLTELEQAGVNTAAAISAAVGDALSVLSGNSGSVSPGTTAIYNAPVTYTDEEQGRRDAKSRARRANTDGWRQ